jgi:hypothetical protein
MHVRRSPASSPRRFLAAKTQKEHMQDMATTPQTPADEARFAALIATAVAEAIKSTQPSIDTTETEIVTAGENADPAIVDQILCEGCKTGNPPFHSDEAVAKSAELLAAGDTLESTRILGPMGGISRKISFDQAVVRNQLAEGFVYTQCKSCGRPR